MSDWETPCPKRVDGIHCVHWYDGEPCCGCGDNGEAVGDPELGNAEAIDQDVGIKR